jgi:hypothetical protein
VHLSGDGEFIFQGSKIYICQKKKNWLQGVVIKTLLQRLSFTIYRSVQNDVHINRRFTSVSTSLLHC